MSRPDEHSRTAQLQKLYFRIGEVSDIVGVEPHVLRYWESEFRSVRPQKSARGQRIYSRRDVETLLKVKELLYGQRFTIAGAKQRLREGKVELSKLTEVQAEPAVAADVSSNASPATVASNGGAVWVSEDLSLLRDELRAAQGTLDELLREIERSQAALTAR